MIRCNWSRIKDRLEGETTITCGENSAVRMGSSRSCDLPRSQPPRMYLVLEFHTVQMTHSVAVRPRRTSSTGAGSVRSSSIQGAAFFPLRRISESSRTYAVQRKVAEDSAFQVPDSRKAEEISASRAANGTCAGSTIESCGMSVDPSISGVRLQQMHFAEFRSSS